MENNNPTIEKYTSKELVTDQKSVGVPVAATTRS